jgi:hypothetical protein
LRRASRSFRFTFGICLHDSRGTGGRKISFTRL